MPFQPFKRWLPARWGSAWLSTPHSSPPGVGRWSAVGPCLPGLACPRGLAGSSAHLSSGLRIVLTHDGEGFRKTGLSSCKAGPLWAALVRGTQEASWGLCRARVQLLREHGAPGNWLPREQPGRLVCPPHGHPEAPSPSPGQRRPHRGPPRPAAYQAARAVLGARSTTFLKPWKEALHKEACGPSLTCSCERVFSGTALLN